MLPGLAHLFHLKPCDIWALRVTEYLVYVHALKNWGGKD